MKTKSKTFISEALYSINENVDQFEEDIKRADYDYINEQINALVQDMLVLAQEADRAGMKQVKAVLEDAIDDLSIASFVSEDELVEAISPEDEAENNILRNIWNKTRVRANSALTPEEKALMKKYNLSRSGGFDSNTRLTYVDPNSHTYRDIMTHPHNRERNVNFADKARKVAQRMPYRDYADNYMWHNWASHDEIEKADEDPSRYPHMDSRALTQNMTQDYQQMRRALSGSKEAQKRLQNMDANYEAKRKELMQKYQQELANLYNNQYRVRKSDQLDIDNANQRIADIKQKHKM